MFGRSDVASLPRPPAWEQLLLENPWPASLALAGVALVLLVMALRRGSRAHRYVSLALILAALAMQLASRATVTPREAMVMQTRALVSATAPLDARAFEKLFRAGATLRGPDDQVWLELDGIVAELVAAVGQRTIISQRIREIQAEQSSADRGRTLLRLSTNVDFAGMGGRDIPTTWMLHWVREEDGQWRVSEAKWLRLAQTQPHLGVWR